MNKFKASILSLLLIAPPLCWNAGANVLVAGSAVFKDGAQEKYQDNLNAIKNSCTK